MSEPSVFGLFQETFAAALRSMTTRWISFSRTMPLNTFRIPPPLTEMIRVCRPGGYIPSTFARSFVAAGLHAFNFLMPYPHFLFSPAFIDRKVREIGVEDLGQVNYALQPTNKIRLAYFRKLWKDSRCEVISLIEGFYPSHLDFIIAHPNGFKGQGLTCEDVSISRIQVTLRIWV
jgi:hypothetical protein